MNGNGTWQSKLTDDRVAFLVKELQNGGKFLPFDELQKMATEKVPGGIGLPESLVKKVVYAVEKKGAPPADADEARAIKLPMGGATATWSKERKAKAVEEVKLCKRGHPRTPENLNKNGACKKCSALYQKARSKRVKREGKTIKAKGKSGRVSAIEAITRAQESSLDNVVSAITELPEQLQSLFGKVKEALQMHKYRKAEITIQNDGAHIALETIPQTMYTKL